MGLSVLFYGLVIVIAAMVVIYGQRLSDIPAFDVDVVDEFKKELKTVRYYVWSALFAALCTLLYSYTTFSIDSVDYLLLGLMGLVCGFEVMIVRIVVQRLNNDASGIQQ